MGKILSLSNSEDSLWYKFPANDETINGLNIVFDLYDLLYTEREIKPNYSYYIKSGRGENSFKIDNEDITVYFIMTKNSTHLILRKSKKWKEYQKAIESIFDFIK